MISSYPLAGESSTLGLRQLQGVAVGGFESLYIYNKCLQLEYMQEVLVGGLNRYQGWLGHVSRRVRISLVSEMVYDEG